MNFEAQIEKYTEILISHKLKILIPTLLLILFATIGAKFLEQPSGYSGFVDNGQPNYEEILNLEEKYGMIDTLSYVIKPNSGDVFQKDVLWQQSAILTNCYRRKHFFGFSVFQSH